MPRIVKWWRDFIEHLARASEQEFHNKPPSCCDAKSEGKHPVKPVVAGKERGK